MTTPNWPTPGSAEEFLRHQTKRLGHLERRRQITSASDLLGPGFGPSAVPVLDWNSDEAAFNGFFYSNPGAINSPDMLQSWIGLTVSSGDDYGVQQCWNYRTDGALVRYIRKFEPGSTGRRYYPWQGDGGWQTDIIVPAETDMTVTVNRVRLDGERVDLLFSGTLGDTIAAALAENTSTQGNYTNQLIGSLPNEFQPEYPWPLNPAFNGPNFAFAVNTNGGIYIASGPVTTAGGGTAVFTGPVQFSIGGTYRLR